ncbi:MAG TPA: hypothetical protein VJL34_13885, partial [Anaerolineales bacterium]|nr:hypothetical protein [Anaerolineales bacterium]
GGPGGPDPQSGGARLWDGDPFDAGYPVYPDPDWVASGGMGSNPYIHADDFWTFFDGFNPGAFTMFELVDTGGGEQDWRKLARDVVVAYLNASWGMAYAYTPAEVAAIWITASNDGTFLYWHTILDAANNAPGGCPISAGGF